MNIRKYMDIPLTMVQIDSYNWFSDRARHVSRLV